VPIYVVIWLHLIAAAALIGGLIFFILILKPGMEGKNADFENKDFLQKMGRRFRTVTWICLITLILTGSYNMLYEGGSARIETTWGVILMLKLFLFAITFGLILIHDFVLDPFGSPSRSSNNPSSQSHSARRATYLQQTILLLSLAILLIAAYLTTM
jgi:putative copper export protein